MCICANDSFCYMRRNIGKCIELSYLREKANVKFRISDSKKGDNVTMIDFSKRMGKKDVINSEDPIKIYEDLDRTSSAGPLRNNQEQILRIWYENRINDKDVIIKMHTGGGKTLIGLLVLLTKLNKKQGSESPQNGGNTLWHRK